MSKPRSEEQQRQYEKRAKRRAVRQLHTAVHEGNLARVNELIVPDIDVNFFYNKETALQIAVCKNHLAICEILIENGADLNQCDAEFHCLLNMAIWRGHLEIAELLVEKGCELNIRNVHGATPLNTAVYKGCTNIVAMLVQQSECDLNAVNKRGQSSLNLACFLGNVDIARILIDAGADLNLIDKQRKTPLATSAEKGQHYIVQMLIKAGCKLNEKSDHGETALYFAAKQGYEQIVHLLIEAGADLDICDNSGSSPFHQAVHGQHLGIVRRLAGAGCGVNQCESFQEFSPLHTAVRMCCHHFFIEEEEEEDSAGSYSALDMVRQLVQCCDLNALDKQHWSPLHHAAFGGELEVVQLLLERKVNVNTVTLTSDSVLHAAVFGNDPEITRLLLQAGCNVNHLNNRRELPLYTAIDNRAPTEMIKLLLDAGSELEVCERERGYSPLFAAVHLNNGPVVEMLVNAGADVNQSSRDGDTALWLACSQGAEDVVSYLLRQPGVDVDAGVSHVPLHTAAFLRHTPIVRRLLQAGADVNKLNDLCISALYYAAEGNHIGLVRLLLHHGADPCRTRPPPQPCCRAYRDRHPHLELHPLYVALKHDNVEVMRLLLAAAVRCPYETVRTLKDLVFRTGYAAEARVSRQALVQIGQLFMSVLAQPRSLKEDCRGVIRRTLGNRPFLTVPKLPLPLPLKDYLLMKALLRLPGEAEAEEEGGDEEDGATGATTGTSQWGAAGQAT